ncbi:MAG: hypothetical protein ACO1SV_14815 [Fimbriimonas sp.]
MRNGVLALLGVVAVSTAVGGAARAQDGASTLANPQPIMIKLEWAGRSPKSTENLTLVVDHGKTASATYGGRNIRVTPTIASGDDVNLRLKITGPDTDSLETEYTIKFGETRVVQASQHRQGRNAKERIFFATANRVE